MTEGETRPTDWSRIQADLALVLGEDDPGFSEALEHCLEAALRGSRMDCGGIYLLDEDTGAVCLAVHAGLTPEYVDAVAHYDATTPQGELVLAGRQRFLGPEQLGRDPSDPSRREGLRCAVVVPVRNDGRVVGCLNLGSHVDLELLASAPAGLDGIAIQVGTLLIRKRAEDAVRESEARYRAVSELTSDYAYSFRVEPDGELVHEWVTGALVRITGFTRSELGERGGWSSLILEEDLPVAYRQLEDLRRGSASTVEYRIVARDGQVRRMRDYSRPERDPATGQVRRIYGAVQDITERTRAERRYRSLFDSLNDAVLVISPEGRILDGNAEACRRLDYEREDLLEASLTDLVSDRSAKLVPSRLMDAQEKGRLVFALEHVTKDGRIIPTEVSMSCHEHEGRLVFLSVGRDVTERRELEQELNQLRKMEAVGQLAGGIAHDFNNMLSPILGYADIMLSGRGEDDPDHRALLFIRDAAQRAASVTRQLLTFSRRQVVEPVLIDLNEQVVEIEGMLRRLLGEDVRLVTDLSSEPTVIRADPSQVQQVILNLAVNARDAMLDGGSLSLRTRVVGEDEVARRDPGEAATGPWVRMTVRDDGIGMSPETLRRIFEPFYTTKEVGRGTGLGLATVYGIVTQHLGRIRVTSEPGQGTAFIIDLPLVRDVAASASPEVGAAVAIGDGETVLVVEDEPLVLDLAATILERHGYLVLRAADGLEALEVASRHAGSIDLLLTDVVMPGMGGQLLRERLAETRPGMRVLFMSGYAHSVVRSSKDLEAPVHFVQKPFTAERLLLGVRGALA